MDITMKTIRYLILNANTKLRELLVGYGKDNTRPFEAAASSGVQRPEIRSEAAR